jgi:hypothetical protein
MKSTVELIRDIPDDTLRDLLGCNRVAIYKWRRGMEEMTERQRETITDHWNEIFPPDEENPDFTHPAFVRYAEGFWKAVEERGFESAYRSWSFCDACACMGPQDGNPFCPCAMRTMTAHRFGKVVPREAADGNP